MVGLIIGIMVVAIPVGLAALIRSLRLEGWKKTVFSIFSILAIAAAIVALVGTLIPDLSRTVVRILFFSSLGVGLLTLALAVHFLRKLHNRVFTEKTKEHHESVARALKEQKAQEEQLKK